MEKNELKALLMRYSRGECTPQEKAWVEDWYLQQGGNAQLPVSEETFQRQIKQIYRRLPQPQRKLGDKRLSGAAAAAVALLLLSALLYLKGRGVFSPAAPSVSQQERIAEAMDILPGGNRATLILADGSRVLLDQAQEGEIYQDETLTIRKTQDGMIEYLSGEAAAGQPGPAFNEIQTPKGGQYQVSLPDGSTVWLNSASVLRYPQRFSEQERRVELQGEAYFEVAKSGVPFYVYTQDQRIRVLGTQFNVSAYPEESAAKTTLVEGSVELAKNEVQASKADWVRLRPGQQARVSAGESIAVSQANLKQALAWKNGYFFFEGTDLKSVMREFSRWYGVEVEFVGEVPPTKLWGEIPKDVPASQALSILRFYELRFKVVERQGEPRIEIKNEN